VQHPGAANVPSRARLARRHPVGGRSARTQMEVAIDPVLRFGEIAGTVLVDIDVMESTGDRGLGVLDA